MTQKTNCESPDKAKPAPPEAARPVLAVAEEIASTGGPRHEANGHSSFYDCRRRVLERIGYPDEYPLAYRPAVVEIASIITEVEVLDGYYPVSVCGEQLPAGMVADVFAELTSEHVMCVLDDFCERPAVRRRRQYLRSMLYNAAMELDLTTLADATKMFASGLHKK